MRPRACRPLAERIADRVATDDAGCLIWLGAKTGPDRKYGHIGRGRRGEGMVRVHRAMYELANGPVPPGLEVDHLCGVTLCCLPSHLEAVTKDENLRRWTAAQGFSPADVRAIDRATAVVPSAPARLRSTA